MSSLMDNLFSPLSKKYCDIYYYLMVFWYGIFLFVIVSGLYYGIKMKKGSMYYFTVFLGALSYGMFYFMTRLLYSMCVGMK